MYKNLYEICPKIAEAREIALGLWKRQKSRYKYWKKQSYAAVDPTTPPSRGERAFCWRNCLQPLGGSHGRLCSAETREKMAARKRGVKQSAAHIKARTGHRKGVKHAPEHAKNLAESIRAKARVWWRHEDLGIRFFGTAPEVVEKFSDRFVGYKPPQGRGLRAGSKLCRNDLNKVQAGKLAHYKGWTAG